MVGATPGIAIKRIAPGLIESDLELLHLARIHLPPVQAETRTKGDAVGHIGDGKAEAYGLTGCNAYRVWLKTTRLRRRGNDVNGAYLRQGRTEEKLIADDGHRQHGQYQDQSNHGNQLSPPFDAFGKTMSFDTFGKAMFNHKSYPRYNHKKVRVIPAKKPDTGSVPSHA